MTSAARTLPPPPDAWEPWDGSPLPPSPELRWGYTTGACLCAALLASLRGAPGPGEEPSAEVLFGDGRTRKVPLSPDLPSWPGFRAVRKNGGDDPDCTHGALLAARLRPLDPSEPADARDVRLDLPRGSVLLRALGGVGVATRAGLDCEPGRWAVTRGAAAMLAANLERAGLPAGDWVAEFVLPDGEALAGRTLNPRLGVSGGLSVLGTTGLVRPLSHEAYAATVRACLRMASTSSDAAVLCTGRRTARAAAEWFAGPRGPGPLPEEAFVVMGDFAAEALAAAAGMGFRRIVVCCMPGKLLKYARGLGRTHARDASQDLDAAAGALLDLFPDETGLADRVAAAAGMREALGLLDPDRRAALLALLAERALRGLSELLGEAGADAPAPELLLCDENGRNPGLFVPGRRP